MQFNLIRHSILIISQIVLSNINPRIKMPRNKYLYITTRIFFSSLSNSCFQNLVDLAYHWRSCSDTRDLLSSETSESSEASSGALRIVVLANGTSRGGCTASFSEDVIAAGRITLIGTGIRIWSRIVRAVKRFNIPRSMDDSHRLPYLTSRRRIIIVLLGLATSLVDDLTAARDCDFFLRHDGRFHAQGCLKSYRGPFKTTPIYKIAVWILYNICTSNRIEYDFMNNKSELETVLTRTACVTNMTITHGGINIYITSTVRRCRTNVGKYIIIPK